eukprot:scaffold32875_cov214-Amphora_coffeaeformis.AAC.1
MSICSGELQHMPFVLIKSRHHRRRRLRRHCPTLEKNTLVGNVSSIACGDHEGWAVSLTY